MQDILFKWLRFCYL